VSHLGIIYKLLHHLMSTYTPPIKEDLSLLKKLAVPGKKHFYNFNLVPRHGYDTTIFEGGTYDVFVCISLFTLIYSHSL